MTLAESFTACRRIARTQAKNFYYSFLLLDRDQKDAMCAVYAFMRYCDDISDQPDPPVEARRAQLQRWKLALERALDGDPGDDPILPAFRATVERYRIPREYFFDLIDGVGSDLEPQRYRTFDDLYGYCYQVASVVGMTITHIYGFDDERALELAEKCGIAFQLTNILRDIAEDAKLGRVYLPDEDLERFGLSREALLDTPSPDTAGLTELIRFELDRAEAYYRQAEPLLGMVGGRSRPALWAIIAIYHGVLERIRELDARILATRARLTNWEKTAVVLRAGRARWLGGRLPYPA